jgi:hypothetical protein
MPKIESPLAQRKPDNPNNRRVRELSKLARDQFPDGHGDYVLPDTPIGRCLALALVTHLARAGQRNGRWLFVFCRDRAPFLDPDEINPAVLLPLSAQELGNGIELTAARRTKLGITSVAPCDQTPAQRAVARKAKRCECDRKRRARERQAKGGPTRAQWLAANTKSKDKPWEAKRMSRAKYYREQARAKRETGTANTYLASLQGEQPVSHGEPPRPTAVRATAGLVGLVAPLSSQRLRDSDGASLSLAGAGAASAGALFYAGCMAAKPGDPLRRTVARAHVTLSLVEPVEGMAA